METNLAKVAYIGSQLTLFKETALSFKQAPCPYPGALK